jgi:hypothetical protein
VVKVSEALGSAVIVTCPYTGPCPNAVPVIAHLPASFGDCIAADHVDQSDVFSGNALARCSSALSIGWRLSGSRPSSPGSV